MKAKKTFVLLCCLCCILFCLCGCSSNDSAGHSENDAQDSLNGDSNSKPEVPSLSNEEMMKKAVLQYPSQNNEWKYNVYDCYIEITGYIGENVETLVIPDSIESLPVWSVNLDYPLSPIGELTIKDTAKSIVFPKDLISIGELAFSGYENVESIILPNSLVEIGYASFNYCKSLNSVFIPETLRTIGDSAFKGCASLKEMTLPASVQEIGYMAFSNTNNEEGIELTVYNSKMSFSNNGNSGFKVIRGYAGSTAAEFAAKKGVPFEVIQ